MDFRNIFVAAFIISIPSCNGGFNLDNYKSMVQSGFSQIPESLEIERLLGTADHFISNNGGGLPRQWNTEVYFEGRYSLAMQVEVKTDNASTTITNVIGTPKFYVHEVKRVTVSADGVVQTSFRDQWDFGIEEWKKVIAAKGDFSVIGIKILHNQPINDFDAYVAGQRRSRVIVRPIDPKGTEGK
ncbi:MAG TPA: hypothetical protein VFE24_05290 [Pirellulales bacterium]|jgi:hypothetical protein|nr:hypothetical protein [Pirellulales bacterium]